MSRDQIIERIYEAAERIDDLDAQRSLLATLGALVPSDVVNFFLIDGGRVLESEVHGVDANVQTLYHERFQRLDPRFRLSSSVPNRVHRDHDAMDPSCFERSEILNDYLLPHGNVRHSLFGSLTAGDGLVLAHAFMRSPGHGSFTDAEAELHQAMLPHLARALRLRHMIRQMRSQLGDLRRALDAVPTPLLMLNDRGAVICANRAAEPLRSGTAIHWSGGTLTSQLMRSRKAIERAVAIATSPRPVEAEAEGAPGSVTIQRDGRRPVTLLFIALRPSSPIRGVDGEARVLVVVHDPDTAVRLNTEVVATLHGLTATEAELAVALASGATMDDFAKARGTSVETARVHLKRIFSKTDTHRQAELVHLLLGTAALQAAQRSPR